VESEEKKENRIKSQNTRKRNKNIRAFVAKKQ